LRQTTRRKYYGRAVVAQALRSAGAELSNAIELSNKPPEPESPLTDSLKKVAAAIARAIEAEKMYILGRKRIAEKLTKEKKAIDDLIQEVVGVPVLPSEKIIAKRKKAEKRKSTR
jgi:hypothetical protein